MAHGRWGSGQVIHGLGVSGQVALLPRWTYPPIPMNRTTDAYENTTSPRTTNVVGKNERHNKKIYLVRGFIARTCYVVAQN